MHKFDIADVMRRNREIYGAFVMDERATGAPADVHADLVSAVEAADRDGSFSDRINVRSALMGAIVSAAEDSDNLTDDDAQRFDTLSAEIEQVREAEQRHQATERREARLAELARERSSRPFSPAYATSEPTTYARGGHSFFRDLAAIKRGMASTDVQQRMQRHMTESRALSTVDGGIGEFVPPKWLLDEFVSIARPGRASANIMPTQGIPAGTDSVSIPRISTGTSVTAYPTQNSAITQVDMTTDSISVPIGTMAGGQTVSQQLIDQAGINVDELVLQDLAADYSRAMGAKVATALATSAGAISVNFSSTYSVAALQGAILNAASQMQAAIYNAPTHVVMRPERWAAIAASFDSTGRPLVALDGPGLNSIASGNPLAVQGASGSIGGIPVITDPQLPNNLGTGTNQDVVIVVRAPEQMLFEGKLNAEAFPQTYANQLSWLFRVYAYSGFTTQRRPKSVAIISGTALTPAAFA